MTNETPLSRRAAWGFVALGIVLVALLTGVALLFSSLPGADQGRDAADGGSSEGTATGATDSPGTATPVPPGETTAAPVAPDAPVDPNPAPPRTSSEVEDPGAGAQDLPPLPPVAPLLAGPLPPAASAEGRLVDGFPSSIPLAEGSSVVTSSVTPGGDRMQATVVADTAASAREVVEYYQGVFVGLGLEATELPASGGSTAMAFRHDGDSITLTATPAVRGSRYSLFGVIGAG
jgi:hypothetical protein